MCAQPSSSNFQFCVSPVLLSIPTIIRFVFLIFIPRHVGAIVPVQLLVVPEFYARFSFLLSKEPYATKAVYNTGLSYQIF